MSRFILDCVSNLGIPHLSFLNNVLIKIASGMLSPIRAHVSMGKFPYGMNPHSIGFAVDEDVATNAAIFLLILFAAAYLLAKKKWVGCFRVFSPLLIAILLISWQPWINRLLVPFFITALIAIAFEFNSFRKSHYFLLFKAFTVVTIVMSILYLMFSDTRSLIRISPKNFGLDSNYFILRPDLAPEYRELSTYLKQNNISGVNLIGNEDTWEYPLIHQNPKTTFYIENPKIGYYLCVGTCENQDTRVFAQIRKFGPSMSLLVRR